MRVGGWGGVGRIVWVGVGRRCITMRGRVGFRRGVGLRMVTLGLWMVSRGVGKVWGRGLVPVGVGWLHMATAGDRQLETVNVQSFLIRVGQQSKNIGKDRS